LKMQMTLKNVEKTLRSYLDLKYHLVGVKLLKNDGSLKEPSLPKTPTAFCHIRAYLNKDFDGRIKFITIHSPVNMPSEEKAAKVADIMKQSLLRPYFVDQRGYWLDLTIKAREDALGIDSFDGSSTQAAIEKLLKGLLTT